MATSEETVERLRNASKIGVKISHIHRLANVSEFKVRELMSETPFTCTYVSKKGKKPREPKPFTESEIESINNAMDEIKSNL